MCLACEGATFDDVMRTVAEKIHTNIVTFVPVIGAGYVYSVGMTGQGMPELYADTKSGFTGTSSAYGAEAAMAPGLEAVARRLIAEGEPPDTATRLYHQEDRTRVETRFRSWSTDRLGVARQFYAGQHVKALRVVQRAQ